MSTAVDADSLVGRVLGEFVIKKRMAQGGGGVAYLADQSRLRREAVIKVMPPGARDDERQQARFLREVRLASRIDHPYAAHVYSFGAEPDGLLWIAMEYVRGTTLATMLKTEGLLPLAKLVPFLEKLCEVLESMHDEGIIHRDVKPANVMVVLRAGRLMPKLLDLGVAIMKDPGARPAKPDAFEPIRAENLLDEEQLFDTPQPIRTADLDRALSMDLTQHGEAVGSPSYMAPEQWIAPWEIDRWTDVYGIGVLAYQCLAGRLPFLRQRSLKLMLAADPAPLPDSVPKAIAAVVMKALNKRPVDRFSTALAFGDALHAAFEEGEHPHGLPELPSSVRQEYLASAPQPIAECMSMLDTARSGREALAALRQLMTACTRALVVMAMAARAQLGAPPGGVDPPLLEELAHADWCALLAALIAPHRNGAPHPLPGLIELCDPEFIALLASTPTASPADLSEEQARSAHAEELPRAQSLLQPLAFLLQHPWVVVRAGSAEKWSGLRQPRRATLTLASRVASDAEFFLLDGHGVPLLRLSPLVQALAPAPSLPAEAFWFEGRGRHGARLVAVPAQFERQDAALWSWLETVFVGPSAAQANEGREEHQPYRGLASFRREDADDYYGREREAEAFANRLKLHTFLAVVGPSGVGKSSFVQAGVAPLLEAGRWKVIVVRPGDAPLAALSAKLAAHGFAGTTETVTEQLALVAASPHDRFLLVIDQFEEVLTLCSDEQERQAYARALAGATASLDAPIRVVVTLRDDFLIRAQSLIALRDQLGAGLQLLATPAEEDLLRILLQPLARVGYVFEDEELPRQMIGEVANAVGALALLSFGASRLWEGRDRNFRRLTRKAFQAMGGVGGALAQHAEKVLSALSVEEQRSVRELFRHLVSSQGTRVVLSRSDLDELKLGGVVGALIDARLLVTSEGPDGEDRIEIIHEALISSWPRLVQWQRENAESARLRDALRDAAKQWVDRGRAQGLLWREEALLEYRVWRSRYAGHLTRAEEDFAASSVRLDSRARKVRVSLASIAFLSLMVGLLVLYRKSMQATQALGRQQSEQARQLSLYLEPLKAYPYATAALGNNTDTPSARFVIGNALARTDAQQRAILLPAQPLVMRESADHQHVALGDARGTIHIFAAGDLSKERTIYVGAKPGSTETVTSLVNLGPATMIACGRTGEMTVFDASTGAILQKLTLETPDDEPTCAAFAGGSLLVVGSPRGRYELWQREESGSFSRVLAAQSSGEAPCITAALTAPDDRSLVLYGGPWCPSGTGALVFESAGPPVEIEGNDTMRSAVFRDDSRTLFFGTTKGELLEVVRTEARGWRIERRLGPYSTALTGLAMAEGLDRIAALSSDGNLRTWRLKDLSPSSVVRAHTREPRGILLLADRRRVVTFGSDNRAVISNLIDGSFAGELVGPAASFSGGLEQPSGRLLTYSLDFTVRAWDLDRAGIAASLPLGVISGQGRRRFAIEEGSSSLFESDGEVIIQRELPSLREIARHARAMPTEHRLFVTRDGRAITRTRDADAGKDTLIIGDLRDVSRPVVEHQFDTMVSDLHLSPDGVHLAMSTLDGTTHLWNLATEEKLELPGSGAQITGTDFSREGRARLLIVDELGGARVVSLADGAILSSWKAREAWGFPVTLSPDGSLAAISVIGGLTQIFSVADRTLVASIHSDTLELVASGWLHDGEMFFTIGFEGDAHLWDAQGWVEVASRRWGPTASFAGLTRSGVLLFATRDVLSVFELPYFSSSLDALPSEPCQMPYTLDREALVTRDRGADCVRFPPDLR